LLLRLDAAAEPAAAERVAGVMSERGRSIAPADLGRLALAAVCWGLGTVISKAALEDIAALPLLAIQLAVSLAILVLVMRVRGIPLRGDDPPLLGRLGVLNPGIAYALSLLGLSTITASLSVLLWVLEPMIILVLAARFLGERITPAFVALSIAAIAGLALVIYEPAMGTSQLIGVALTMAGVLCCAVYTVTTRRLIPGARETGQVVLAQQAHALAFALLAVIVATLLGAPSLPASVSMSALAAAAVSGALYYAGAYWFYLGALRRVPASLASVSYYLIPIVGVTAGALLLGERLDARQWVGVVVVLGAVIGAFGQREAREDVSAEVIEDGRATTVDAVMRKA
jgi:drug/metabolite transporter (DMT)-like permease